MSGIYRFNDNHNMIDRLSWFDGTVFNMMEACWDEKCLARISEQIHVKQVWKVQIWIWNKRGNGWEFFHIDDQSGQELIKDGRSHKYSSIFISDFLRHTASGQNLVKDGSPHNRSIFISHFLRHMASGQELIKEGSRHNCSVVTTDFLRLTAHFTVSIVQA